MQDIILCSAQMITLFCVGDNFSVELAAGEDRTGLEAGVEGVPGEFGDKLRVPIFILIDPGPRFNNLGGDSRKSVSFPSNIKTIQLNLIAVYKLLCKKYTKNSQTFI